MACMRERRTRDDIASERIGILFERAAGISGKDWVAAGKLVKLAHSISLRCRTPIPRCYQMRYCRKCLAYFTSANMQTRLNPQGRVVEWKCLGCGYVRRFRYQRK